MDQITAKIKGHGTFTVSANAMDWAIERLLPASPKRLQEMAREGTGIDYSDVRDVSSLLIVIADILSPYEACGCHELDTGCDHATCADHGDVRVVSSDRFAGYAGTIYEATLSCGCQVVDTSADLPQP